jgi:hypothetical protein
MLTSQPIVLQCPEEQGKFLPLEPTPLRNESLVPVALLPAQEAVDQPDETLQCGLGLSLT